MRFKGPRRTRGQLPRNSMDLFLTRPNPRIFSMFLHVLCQEKKVSHVSGINVTHTEQLTAQRKFVLCQFYCVQQRILSPNDHIFCSRSNITLPAITLYWQVSSCRCSNNPRVTGEFRGYGFTRSLHLKHSAASTIQLTQHKLPLSC